MKGILDAQHLLGAVVYTGLGVGAFTAWFMIFDKLTPYDLWSEIVAKQNRALATVVGAISISIGLIVAAAILG